MKSIIFYFEDKVVLQFCFFRMDEMMQGQRGWRELAVLGDKINKFTGMIEGLIWSPRGSDSNNHEDDWAFEEVISEWTMLIEATPCFLDFYLTQYKIMMS